MSERTVDPYKDEDDFSEDEEDTAYKRFATKYKLGKTIGS
jgi:hypothetical protein